MIEHSDIQMKNFMKLKEEREKEQQEPIVKRRRRRRGRGAIEQNESTLAETSLVETVMTETPVTETGVKAEEEMPKKRRRRRTKLEMEQLNRELQEASNKAKESSLNNIETTLKRRRIRPQESEREDPIEELNKKKPLKKSGEERRKNLIKYLIIK